MKRIFLLLAAFFSYVGMAMAAVNINTANMEQLESLPGIGPAKAQAIIEYRAKNGLFKMLEDLKKVEGIGDKTFDGLKSHVTLTGMTKIEETKSEGKKGQTPVATKKEISKEKTPSTKKTNKKEIIQEKPVKGSPKNDKKETKEVKADKAEKDTKKANSTKTSKDDKTADAPKK